MGNRVTELLKAKRRQVRHLALVLVLALLVAAGVGGIFHLPAIAKTYQKTVLACTAVPPTGPGYAGFFVHVHNDDCFDENGNLKNWWKEEDFAAFKELTRGMVEQFDGIEFHGGKVSGELTVSENIADNGGMGVTLEIMHTLPDPDYPAYFKNWARVWCQKAKEEYIQLLLANDVHSPTELRANMMPRNFPEWYEAFGVTESDGMYIAPEKRISIW